METAKNPEQVATAQAAAEQKLSDATIKQLSFKPSICRDVAILIVSTMLKDRIRWADDFDFSFVPETSKNVIGLTWKRLTQLGIVSRMDHFRRSTAKAARGRTVWKYWLISPKLAETFLQRNGKTILSKQPEMFIVNGGKVEAAEPEKKIKKDVAKPEPVQ